MKRLIFRFFQFAKGKLCPYCKTIMYAQDEKEYPAGYEVTYVCRNGNCGHKERVWEDK
ncbi:MAG: hypothetical protein QM725_16820 [Lacibacter sp.]